MDPASMILALALKNPNVTASVVTDYRTPGQVETARLNESLADFAIQTLRCYHKTARFRGVQLLADAWPEQSKFGADNSIVMRIDLSGVSGSPYQMLVAAMSKGSSYRTFVIRETTLVPYNKNCQLENWTSM